MEWWRMRRINSFFSSFFSLSCLLSEARSLNPNVSQSSSNDCFFSFVFFFLKLQRYLSAAWQHSKRKKTTLQTSSFTNLTTSLNQHGLEIYLTCSSVDPKIWLESTFWHCRCVWIMSCSSSVNVLIIPCCTPFQANRLILVCKEKVVYASLLITSYKSASHTINKWTETSSEIAPKQSL